VAPDDRTATHQHNQVHEEWQIQEKTDNRDQEQREARGSSGTERGYESRKQGGVVNASITRTAMKEGDSLKSDKGGNATKGREKGGGPGKRRDKFEKKKDEKTVQNAGNIGPYNLPWAGTRGWGNEAKRNAAWSTWSQGELRKGMGEEATAIGPAISAG